MMNVLELFSGTESFGQVARELFGCSTITVDADASFHPSLCADVLELDSSEIYFHPDVIWASPPCTAFSIASVGHHWKGHTPSREAVHGIGMVAKTLELIMALRPTYYFIENPRGMLRSLPVMAQIPYHTVTYCQYGDTRMKPTDIWTNCDLWHPRPACKNGDPCHESAPRGARTGTQGLALADRSRVPLELCWEILSAIEPQASLFEEA